MTVIGRNIAGKRIASFRWGNVTIEEPAIEENEIPREFSVLEHMMGHDDPDEVCYYITMITNITA